MRPKIASEQKNTQKGIKYHGTAQDGSKVPNLASPAVLMVCLGCQNPILRKKEGVLVTDKHDPNILEPWHAKCWFESLEK